MLIFDSIHSDVRRRLILKDEVHRALDFFRGHWNTPGPREGGDSIPRERRRLLARQRHGV